MVSEQQTRKVKQELRTAGFIPARTVGSPTWWQHGSGRGVAVPDGHKVISPGVYRSIVKAMKEVQ